MDTVISQYFGHNCEEEELYSGDEGPIKSTSVLPTSNLKFALPPIAKVILTYPPPLENLTKNGEQES